MISSEQASWPDNIDSNEVAEAEATSPREVFERCMSQQLKGLELIRGTFMESCAEKDSLLRAEQGQNSYLRDQNRALHELVTKISSEKERLDAKTKDEIANLSQEKQRLMHRVARLESEIQKLHFDANNDVKVSKQVDQTPTQ